MEHTQENRRFELPRIQFLAFMRKKRRLQELLTPSFYNVRTIKLISILQTITSGVDSRALRCKNRQFE